ncbi:MAG: hypothetical protein P8Y00_12835, partial [Deltaproteobacteria bacterium]
KWFDERRKRPGSLVCERLSTREEPFLHSREEPCFKINRIFPLKTIYPLAYVEQKSAVTIHAERITFFAVMSLHVPP